MGHVIGIDVGATNIRAAIINEDFVITWQNTHRTIRNDKAALLSQIATLINEALTINCEIIAIGIGIAGPVDSTMGTASVFPNIGVRDIDVKGYLSTLFLMPIYVLNDANAASLTEALIGSGKGYRVVQYITLSTGIGAGLVVEGKLWTGKYGYAQEIGNMIIDSKQSAPNPSMNAGSFEACCSGESLVKFAHQNHFLVDNARDVFENPQCKDIVKQWLIHMGVALANIINIIEPDVIVIGGGLMKSSNRFFDQILPHLQPCVYQALRDKIILKKAMFDQTGGIIGAAIYAFNNLNSISGS